MIREDFGFALKRFDELGYNERISRGHGHACMASQSQNMATVSWAASMLYKSTKDKELIDIADDLR